MPLSARRSGVIIAAVALALAGCGSGDVATDNKPAVPQDGSDPVAWVGALCGGIGNVVAGVASIAKSQPTPQGQKDGLIAFSNTAQQAFTDASHKLEQLGPPRITDGKRVHDTAVGFFTTAAKTVGEQRDKLAALDANDPEFVQKAGRLQGPDLGAASTQMQQLTSNNELAPAFGTAPECKQLGSAPQPKPAPK